MKFSPKSIFDYNEAFLFIRKCGISAMMAWGTLSISLVQAAQHESNVALNRAAWQSSAINSDDTAQLATDGNPDTFWQSLPEDEPWIYVDLGGAVKISGVELDWGAFAPAACKVQTSNEQAHPEKWKDIAQISCAAGKKASVRFGVVEARFVRVLAAKGSAPGGCQLRELAVEGEKTEPEVRDNPALSGPDEWGKILLDGGGWRLQNAIFVHEAPEVVSSSDYPAGSWLRATVPGTVLANYLADGAVPDPNYGEQQKLISESYFQHDFWYRKEFTGPELGSHEHIALNFAGINWKADIYLNGGRIGHIDGAFMRGGFDVTDKLLPGKSNVLAVLIHPCANPGPTNQKDITPPSHNGGILGKDSPTFVASLGWNWMPSVRGRDTGIWDHVWLGKTGPVVAMDPFVQTTVSSDLHHAKVKVQVTLQNKEATPVKGVLTGQLGKISFTRDVQLPANGSQTVTIDPSTCPQLTLVDPPLWWPNGYGEQPLKQLELTFAPEHGPSSQEQVRFGIRELSYDTTGNVLKIRCNGRFIQLNGGNWGMDETMLRYEAKDYDTAVKLHKDMHLTMIRNWVGQVGKEEFFDACDRYGILVWNDFWLANPSDGANPDDHEVFMANVKDRILRIRNHPSLALYCGRNEGNPPKDLDAQMAEQTSALDGSRYYIPHSAAGLVTGHGPYEPKADAWYFENRGKTLHSELGIVCVPTADTMRLMMPAKDLWPIGPLWKLHDYYQPRCKIYSKMIEVSYGPATGLDSFCKKAQMLNMAKAKAMMECWRSNRGSGGLIWMSHPAWPSLICQLYDYYLNPTAAYFGVKKGCEPLHILWNSATNEVQVANDTVEDVTGVVAEASVFDLKGNLGAHQSVPVDIKAGTAADCFSIDPEKIAAPVQFIELKLKRGDAILSNNFYWHGTNEDYTALSQLPQVQPTGKVERLPDHNGSSVLRATITNPSSTVALMLCLKLVRDDDKHDRVLPIYYEDNYISLLPHETRKVSMEFDEKNLGGSDPLLFLEGWNVSSEKL